MYVFISFVKLSIYTLFLFISDSYDKARDKLPDAEFTSDLLSEDSDIERGNRKRKAYRNVISDEECETEEKIRKNPAR